MKAEDLLVMISVRVHKDLKAKINEKCKLREIPLQKFLHELIEKHFEEADLVLSLGRRGESSEKNI